MKTAYLTKGSVLGNHSYSHPYFPNLCLDECYTQIRKTDDVIERLYERAKVSRRVSYFGIMYGDKGGFRSWRYSREFHFNCHPLHMAVQQYEG